jgi:hypothetical protein
MTFKPGTYHIHAQSPAFMAGEHSIRLYNITDSTVAIDGMGANSGKDNMKRASRYGNSISTLSGIIDITSTKVFELQHIRSSSNNSTTTAFGSATGQGQEVYSIITVIDITYT